MRRREFVWAISGAAAAWPLAARAQPRKDAIIGILVSGGGAVSQAHVAAFQAKLKELRGSAGQGLRFEVREVRSERERARELAAELVALSPDVIIATNTEMTKLVLERTRTIPIVFVTVPDPVGSGLVESVARPGGNVTGFINFDAVIATKWLELLKELSPRLTKVIVVVHEGNPTAPGYLRVIQAAASKFSVDVVPKMARDLPTIEAAINSVRDRADTGVIVPPSALTTLHLNRIIKLLAERGLPSMYPYREFPAAGGLMSYGYDRVELYRQTAIYTDRILRGTKPSELPVQAATKFELVINLTAAKRLGLQVPMSLLMRVDEVIE